MSDETSSEDQPNASSEPAGVASAPEEETPDTQTGGIRPRVIEVLKTVYDPEIPVDIYELGLIYEVAI